MLKVEKPKKVIEKKYDEEEFLFKTKGDINKEGMFQETFLKLDKYNLIVEENNNIKKDVFLLEEIEDIKIEEYISINALNVVTKGEEKTVCYFTNGLKKDIYKLIEYINKLKKGETVENIESEEKTDTSKRKKNISTILRLLSYGKKYIPQMSIVLIGILLSSVFYLLTPYLSGKVLFDKVLIKGGKYYGKVTLFVLLIVLTRLAVLALNVVTGRINSKVSADIVSSIKVDIFEAMQKQSMSFYTNKLTGVLMNRINADAMGIYEVFIDFIPYFIVNVFMIVGVCVMMFTLNWKISILMCIPIALSVLYFRVMHTKLRGYYQKAWVKKSKLRALMNDSLTGFRVVKAFGKEKEEVSKFSKSNYEFSMSDLEALKKQNVLSPIMKLIIKISTIVVWILGGVMVIKDKLTFGELMSFVWYFDMFFGPVEFMTRVFQAYGYYINAAERIFQIMDCKPEVQEKSDALELKDLKGKISIKNVSFGYEPNRTVLKNVDLEIKEGEFLGVVGHTGAGKSTLANLILRLYDTNEGEVLIDGVNVKDLTINSVRQNVAMVSQETFLFMGSIADNIRYGKPKASLEEVIRAAKIANAHEFIMKMPDAYDTIIGTGGKGLSGGERQRISIARAILMNPKILILDEATASLDTNTERQIQESIQTLIKGKTTIAIAHRLSTLRDANKIAVIEEGCLKELGTHLELVLKKGIYYKMLQRQAEAIKIKGVD